jgi:alpha-L-fucosidase
VGLIAAPSRSSLMNITGDHLMRNQLVLRPLAKTLRLSFHPILLTLLFLPVRLYAQEQTLSKAQLIGDEGNSMGFDMAPETNIGVVNAAVKRIPKLSQPGPVQPTWESLQQNYKVPAWFVGAKFGIFIHWGLFSVPAHGNEWYEKWMYAGGSDNTVKSMHGGSNFVAWHTEHFGPPDKFGYKDFIPMFKAEKFDAETWAELFKKAGARYVVPGAEHHENFAMWDSQVTPFNAMKMGPKRDVIGELSKAVRQQGMKFGVANHGIENFQFINPPAELAEKMKAEKADLYDPAWADFYNVADRSDAAMEKFLVNWYARNVELIDKYRPDLIYFDNGVDQRYLDPLKLNIAAYYYNSAKSWGKEVSLTTKKASFAPSGMNSQTIGSIIDFEGHTPPGIRTGEWEEDITIANGGSWGYTTALHAKPVNQVIGILVDAVSKNGSLLLNVSPMSDGTIPQDQQDTLLALGKWLETNGEAIYDTHAWIKFQEPGNQNIHFTVKGGVLYAIVAQGGKAPDLLIPSLATGKGIEGKVKSVAMLGSDRHLQFTRDASGLRVSRLPGVPADQPFALKIIGLKMNPSPDTASGEPLP